jgi:hypothetical protein
MKKYLSLIALPLAFACTAPSALPELPNGVIATVSDQRAKDGCAWVLIIQNENGPQYLEPVELADSFKVNGKKVILTYHNSRSVSHCDNSTPIVIDVIKGEE